MNRAIGFYGRPAFVKGRDYQEWLKGVSCRVGEPPSGQGFGWTERHVQCVWFDHRFRRDVLMTSDGEPIRVLDPGRWNLGAGPDFLGATLLIGRDERVVRGDVEIHVTAEDWNRHGHREDSRYDGVCLHVTWTNTLLERSALPLGCSQLALCQQVIDHPCLLDTIDVAAYPFSVDVSPGSHAELFRSLGVETLEAMLDAAGEYRLSLGVESARDEITAVGADQALYEAIMVSLGYSRNKASFRRLARAVPLTRLREEADGDLTQAYALLAGVGGLLPEIEPGMDEATVSFLTNLWRRWWKLRDRWEPFRMNSTCWVRHGIRPLNYPERRLMVAAEMMTRVRTPGKLLLVGVEGKQRWELTELQQVFELQRPVPYWGTAYTWGRATNRVSRLLGRDRGRDMLTNVAVPWLMAMEPGLLTQLGTPELRAGADNELIRSVAHAILGPDHNSRLYRNGIRQQGLLQIFRDFFMMRPDRAAEELLRDAIDRFESQRRGST